MARKPLKVLFLYDCIFPESMGGVEHRNRELATELARRGHKVTLAGWTDSPPKEEAGLRVEPLSFKTELYERAGKRRPVAALRLAAAALKLDVRPYDVIETANIPYLHLFVLAARCDPSPESRTTDLREFS